MFCGHRRSAGATKRQDKMCLWSTAGTPEPPGQAPPDTLEYSLHRPPLRYLCRAWRLAQRLTAAQ